MHLTKLVFVVSFTTNLQCRYNLCIIMIYYNYIIWCLIIKLQGLYCLEHENICTSHSINQIVFGILFNLFLLYSINKYQINIYR